MPRSLTVLLVAALALVAAGIGGVATHGGRSKPSSAATTTTAPATAVPEPPTTAGPPAPSSTQLAAEVITPTDMGGYYRTETSLGAAFARDAPCLAGLAPSPAQDGRAVNALVGPDAAGIPTIVEIEASYPEATADSVFRAVSAALGSCQQFACQFAGQEVQVPLTPLTIPPVGDADAALSGPFTADGARFGLSIGVVLQGSVVIALAFVQSVPPADPIMGNFTSTLSLAIGKLA